ncbi:acyl-CoA N-acyltransferase [Polychytrium aggregatum]|uniref:acyl-CoA N-acyltransferase n=1 Tax=Polychytrium aggregatum TaxID=110093 RepID=UPI0022FDD2CC|nr:acyl-CoA N-acyltransferase [Polychytrium aggregatum]KAI9193723.1 acyl-CoA N-acyltransferase [Polychytrium aggregatum]
MSIHPIRNLSRNTSSNSSASKAHEFPCAKGGVAVPEPTSQVTAVCTKGVGEWAPCPKAAVSFVEEVRGSVIGGQVKAVVNVISRTTASSGVKSWPGVVANNTFFLRIPEDSTEWDPQGFGFKESVLAILELAEGCLECENVVICLEKSRADLTPLMRAFMFVGFELVHPSIYMFDSSLVLLGCAL